MSKRISLKLTDKNDWLVDKLNEEKERKNNYDNYVTGGNSKLKIDPLLSQLHLDYIYEEQEVDCNFI